MDENSLRQIRLRAKQLEHCVIRLRERVWQADLSNALADSAEVAEISRRIYSLIEQHISASARTHQPD